MKLTSFIRRIVLTSVFLTCVIWSAGGEIVGKITIVDLTGISEQESLNQMVYSAIGTKVGQPFSPIQLSKDVSTLIKRSGVSDVQSTIDTLPDGTRHVTFLLKLKNNIVEKRCEGNKEYTHRYIMDLTKAAIGQPPNDLTIAADRKAIMEKYEQEGFYGTEVTTRQTPSEDGKGLILTYVITEKPRYKLKGVSFRGNTAFSDSELSEVLLTKRPWWRYIIRFGNFYNGRLQPIDIENILTLYATKGYLDCQVAKVELKPLEDDPQWVTPTFVIQEGPQYTFGHRSFIGNRRFTAAQFEERCRMKTGDVYTSRGADADLSNIRALYEALGYLELSITPELDKDPRSHRVNITYRVSEGDISRIGRIIITGNEDTRDRVIRRELTIFEDDLADQRKIDQSKRRLENLGYFEDITITSKRTNSPSQRDLVIDVTEKATGTISVGAGFSTEDSVMGFLELSETNFSLDRLLKFQRPKGDGQHMRSHIGIGSETSSIDISLTEPSLMDSQFELTGELFLNKRYEDEYDERSIGAGLTLSWPVAFTLPFLGDHIEYWKISTGFRIEQFRISDIEDEEQCEMASLPDNAWRYPEGMDYLIGSEEGSEWGNRIALSFVRDTRNRYIFPDRGSRLSLDLEYITRALGSYADYMKFHVGGELFLPLYDTLFMRLSLDGSTVEHIGGDDVKIFDRYFAGGYGSVRGFKRHDISPVNKNENSIGGSTMLCSTVEVLKPVGSLLFLKFFCDAGGVWWDSFDADFSELNASVGIGIQFRKLPIRLDYGIPVITGCDHLSGHSGRLHFSIDYAY